MQWGYCGNLELEFQRLQILSEAVKDKGFPNTLVRVEWPKEMSLDEAAGSLEHLRFGEDYQNRILKEVKIQSSWISLLGLADGIKRVHSKWWPLCAGYDALCLILEELGEDLDTKESALIAGSGPITRSVVAALFRCGFQRFKISSADSVQVEALVAELKTKFFGLEFKIISPEQIVLLHGENSILVNTDSSGSDQNLAHELSYLNFLKRPGVVLDWSQSLDSELLKETRDIGVRTLTSADILARIDRTWARWAFGVELSQQDYLKRLKEISPAAT